MIFCIPLSGLAKAGKGTAAEYLRQRYQFEVMSVAGPLKEMAAIGFDLDEKVMHDPVLKEAPLEAWAGISPRQILQIVGTELFRERLPQMLPQLNTMPYKLWATLLQRKLAKLDPTKDHWIVIEDARMEDERRMLAEHTCLCRAKVVLVDATGTPVAPSTHLALSAETQAHSTEISAQEQPVDVVWNNVQGDVNALYRQIDATVQNLRCQAVARKTADAGNTVVQQQAHSSAPLVITVTDATSRTGTD